MSTGFSQTCIDTDSDGICDSSYELDSSYKLGNNIDYLPLVYNVMPPTNIINLTNKTFELIYINWTWTDPVDSDFSKVMIYLDGMFQTNISKSVQYYNATGLIADTQHTIATRTVDTSGNVNQTWTNHTARTAPATSPVELTIEINPDSINPNSQGTIKVTIYNNTPAGFDVSNIDKSSVKFGRNGTGYKDYETPTEKLILHFDTQDTGIMCGDTQATLTGKTYGGLDIVGTGNFVTTGCGGRSGGGSNEGNGDRGSNKGDNSGSGGSRGSGVLTEQLRSEPIPTIAGNPES